MENISDITVYQIEEMQHAVGFNKSKVTGTKHRIMHCYRNYYCTHKDDAGWQDLASRGLARAGRADREGIVNFYVTKDGFEFLANLCGFKKMYETD